LTPPQKNCLPPGIKIQGPRSELRHHDQPCSIIAQGSSNHWPRSMLSVRFGFHKVQGLWIMLDMPWSKDRGSRAANI
jgi:hypothetical protein